MAYNYPLRYRTYNQALDEIKLDMTKYAIEDMISPEQLIKVAKKVNYDLGLRIMKTSEQLLEVENYKVKLPDDFYVLNYALICEEIETTQTMPQGTHIDERIIPQYQTVPPETGICDPAQINCRTTVNGCCQCADTCSCTGDCGGLCTQCSSENTNCSTTNVEQVTETTTTPEVLTTVHYCSWLVTIDQMSGAETLTISIDSHGYECAIGGTLVDCLNAYDLGTFTLNTIGVGGGTVYILSVIGDHEYGQVLLSGRVPIYIDPVCIDVETVLTDTRVCIWAVNTKTWNDMTYGSIDIDTLHYVFIGYPPTASEMNGWGLGTFNVMSSGGLVIISVHGTHNYGVLTYNDKDEYVEPLCTNVTNTAATTQTSTTTNVTRECASNPPLCRPRIEMNCNGDYYELVQIVNASLTQTFRRLLPLKILQNAESVDCCCPNLYISDSNTGWIKNGFLYTNFESGRVYINYQGMLVDEDNNVLVPDHDGLNEYYEYALKDRILENLVLNGETVTETQIKMVKMGLRSARIYALTIVNTPNFAEMKQLWWANRRAQYSKYYDMFKSYRWYPADWNPNYDAMVNNIL